MKLTELERNISEVEDAKYITDQLLYRVRKIAEFICGQMEELGLKEVMKGKYVVNEVLACGQSFSLFSLKVTDESDFYEYPVSLVSNEVSSTRKLKFFGGDYNAKFYLPNRHDVLMFIEDVPKIMADLASCDNELNFI